MTANTVPPVRHPCWWIRKESLGVGSRPGLPGGTRPVGSLPTRPLAHRRRVSGIKRQRWGGPCL
jgi:hypothetical protein